MWIFPSNDVGYCYYGVDSFATKNIELTGAAGVIYIDNGSGFEAYQVYIDNGTSWDFVHPLYRQRYELGYMWVIF